MKEIHYRCIMPDCKYFAVIRCSEDIVPVHVKCGKCGSDMIVYRSTETEIQIQERKKYEAK